MPDRLELLERLEDGGLPDQTGVAHEDRRDCRGHVKEHTPENCVAGRQGSEEGTNMPAEARRWICPPTCLSPRAVRPSLAESARADLPTVRHHSTPLGSLLVARIRAGRRPVNPHSPRALLARSKQRHRRQGGPRAARSTACSAGPDNFRQFRTSSERRAQSGTRAPLRGASPRWARSGRAEWGYGGS